MFRLNFPSRMRRFLPTAFLSNGREKVSERNSGIYESYLGYPYVTASPSYRPYGEMLSRM